MKVVDLISNLGWNGDDVDDDEDDALKLTSYFDICLCKNNCSSIFKPVLKSGYPAWTAAPQCHQLLSALANTSFHTGRC